MPAGFAPLPWRLRAGGQGGEDRGEGLGAHLGLLPAPVQVAGGDPGGLGPPDQFGIGHRLMMRQAPAAPRPMTNYRDLRVPPTGLGWAAPGTVVGASSLPPWRSGGRHGSSQRA